MVARAVIYTLTMIVCLVSAPADCRPHEVYLQGGLIMAPTLEAQTAAVEWLGKHPEMFMKTMKLEPGRAS